MSHVLMISMMLDTSCTNDEADPRADYALISLTPAYVTEILRYMDLMARMLQTDSLVYAIERWNYEARYLDFDEKMATTFDVHGIRLCEVPRGHPIFLTADPDFAEASFIRIDCQTIQIADREVWWTACLKFTNDRVETLHLTKKVLLDIQCRFSRKTIP